MEQHQGARGAVTASLRESVALVSDPKNLDETVDEVFQLMLGVTCRHNAARSRREDAESLTAVVGFGGPFSGACVFRAGAQTALKIAGRMTNSVHKTLDHTVKDAAGEICNMLAGVWKGKVPELAASCRLSIPAVITGRDYNLHVLAPEFEVRRHYGFDDASFEVTIICDGLD